MLIFFLFLKHSKIDISQDVKLLSGHFECSQRNPDHRVRVEDTARNNLVDCDAAIVNGLTSWPRISHNRGIYTALLSQLMASVDDSIWLCSFRGGRCHLRDQMLGDRLLALRADIGHTAKNV